jgi:glucokinase
VVGITLGTGVGGAIVEDGRLRGGRFGFGGEIGHMSLEMDGPPSPCGNRGCLELYVGRRALVAAYLSRAGWGPGRITFDLARGEREELDPKLLYDAANRGDTAAREVFARAGIVVGVALANLTNLIDPEVFVIGGGVAQAGDLLLEPARRTLAERAMLGASRVPAVLPAALGTGAGLIGAALHALRGLAG